MSIGNGSGKSWSDAGENTPSGLNVNNGFITDGQLSFSSGDNEVKKFFNPNTASVYYQHIVPASPGIIYSRVNNTQILAINDYTSTSGWSLITPSFNITDPGAAGPFTIKGVAAFNGDLYTLITDDNGNNDSFIAKSTDGGANFDQFTTPASHTPGTQGWYIKGTNLGLFWYDSGTSTCWKTTDGTTISNTSRDINPGTFMTNNGTEFLLYNDSTGEGSLYNATTDALTTGLATYSGYFGVPFCGYGDNLYQGGEWYGCIEAIYKANTAVSSWSLVTEQDAANITSLIFADNGNIVANYFKSGDNKSSYVSTNSGASFTPTNQLGTGEIFHSNYVKDTDGTIISVTTSTTPSWRTSTDNGLTWTQYGPGSDTDSYNSAVWDLAYIV